MPALKGRAIDRELKRLRGAIGQHPALRFIADESQTIGGFRGQRWTDYRLGYRFVLRIPRLNAKKRDTMR